MPNVERKSSQGLEFKVLDDGTCEVAGIGSCMDTDIVIPADDGEGHKVTRIGDSAFWGCKGLTSLTIPNSVTSIGGYAFYGCYGLTGITIPESVTSIGEWAFADCTGLTNITIPDGVTEIPTDAFAGCTELTNITIPDSVTKIGDGAFYHCEDLTSITIPDGVTRIGTYAFEDCTSLQTFVCSAWMKDKLDNDRECYGLSDNVNIVTPEEYAAKEKKNDGPSLDDD